MTSQPATLTSSGYSRSFHPKPYPSYHRIAQPLFSSHGLRDVGYEFWIVGVLTLALLVS